MWPTTGAADEYLLPNETTKRGRKNVVIIMMILLSINNDGSILYNTQPFVAQLGIIEQ